MRCWANQCSLFSSLGGSVNLPSDFMPRIGLDLKGILMLATKEAIESATPTQALRWAAEKGDYQTVEMLLTDKKADANADYAAALRDAAKEGHLEIVRLLLENGANPFVLGSAPLIYAKERAAKFRTREDNEMVEILENRINGIKQKHPDWEPPAWR